MYHVLCMFCVSCHKMHNKYSLLAHLWDTDLCLMCRLLIFELFSIVDEVDPKKWESADPSEPLFRDQIC